MMADRIYIPSLLSQKLGISTYTAKVHCSTAVLSIDDRPVPITQADDRYWVNVEEEDYGKKLTVKGNTNTYVVMLEKLTGEEEDDSRDIRGLT